MGSAQCTDEAVELLAMRIMLQFSFLILTVTGAQYVKGPRLLDCQCLCYRMRGSLEQCITVISPVITNH